MHPPKLNDGEEDLEALARGACSQTGLLSTNLQTPNTNLLSFLSTLKVLRKCRDMDRAEKLLDEMLERGVKLDNVTFSTLSTCAS